MAKLTIADTIRKAISEGKGPRETMYIVHEQFPNASTTVASYNYYKKEMGTKKPQRLPVNKVELRLKILLAKFNKHFKANLKMPLVTYDLKGASGGRAIMSRAQQFYHIRLNPVYLRNHENEYIAQTVAHELAHIAVNYLHGKVRPHGNEWKKMMEFFGAEPRCYHTYDTSHVQTRSHIYKCECREIPLSTLRHNKILRGLKYKCKKCNTLIVKA